MLRFFIFKNNSIIPMIYKNFGMAHWGSLGLVLLASLLASIHPLEFAAYLLHQSGTVVMVILLILLNKRFGYSLWAFHLYNVFLILHIIGAHYLYSYVPYNELLIHEFGFDLDQFMGWPRNMYDRLIHFGCGLLLYPFIYRTFEAWLPPVKPYVLFLLAIQFIMASSLIYELLEWWIALTMSPEAAENYNGQQGDAWDAHKDMFLAILGGVFYGLPALYAAHRKNKQVSY